jgi:hypothetical protein
MRMVSRNCKGLDAKGAKRGAMFREERLMRFVGVEVEEEV